MNIIITMAGDGRRFRDVGYTVPKHEIVAAGRSLFAWSLESLRNFFAFPFYFVTRQEHAATHLIESYCAAEKIPLGGVVELAELTKGQAETVLKAKSSIIDHAAPVLIYNIDTYVEPQALHPNQIRGDGWLPCFDATGDKWSFVKFSTDYRVHEVAEKRRISNYGTIGLYYFSSFSLFEASLEACSFSGYRELFVAPLYQTLIDTFKREVFTHAIDPKLVHVLGTPEDLAEFNPR